MITCSDPNRLDRIEALVESNSREITQFLTAAQLELARSMDVLMRRVDRVEQQVAQMVESQQALRESPRSLSQSMERLTDVQVQPIFRTSIRSFIFLNLSAHSYG